MARTKSPISDFVGFIETQPYVSRNLILTVIREDKKIDPRLMAALKDILELHAVHVSGVESAVELSLPAKGKATVVQKQQKLFARFTERFGKPITHVLNTWITDGLAGRDKADIEAFGICILIIEPDPTHLHPVDVWSISGLHPVSMIGIKPERNLDAEVSGVGSDIEVVFDGTTRYRDPSDLAAARQFLLQCNQASKKSPFLSKPAAITKRKKAKT